MCWLQLCVTVTDFIFLLNNWLFNFYVEVLNLCIIFITHRIPMYLPLRFLIVTISELVRVGCKAEVVVHAHSSSTPETGQREHRLKPARTWDPVSRTKQNTPQSDKARRQQREWAADTHDLLSFNDCPSTQGHSVIASLNHNSQKVGKHSLLPPACRLHLLVASLTVLHWSSAQILQLEDHLVHMPLSCLNLK